MNHRSDFDFDVIAGPSTRFPAPPNPASPPRPEATPPTDPRPADAEKAEGT